MRRLLVLFCLYTVSCFCTTLVGTLNYPNATGASGYLIMSLSQQAALSSSGGCGGPIEVVPTYQYRITVTNGALVGSPSVYGNDCMLPQGTYYDVQMTDTNANVLFTDRWVITGTTLNIGTIVSATITGTTQTLGQAGVVLTQPSASQNVNQGPGTNLGINLLNVTQILTLPNGGTCDSSGCSGIDSNSVTTNTNQTISGQKTFSQDILFGSTTNLGSTAAPATNGYFTGTLWLGDCLNLFLGSVASYSDTHCFANSSSGNVGLYTSLGTLVADWSDTSGFDSKPLFYVNGGYVQGQAGSIMNTHSGDFACSGVPDGMFTVRTDVNPPELQTCYGGVVYSSTSTAGVTTVTGTAGQVIASPTSHNVNLELGNPLQPPGKVILAAPLSLRRLPGGRLGAGPGTASIQFTPGAAPTSGWSNGDTWNVGGDLYMYDGTTTQEFAWRSTPLSALTLLPAIPSDTFLGNNTGGSTTPLALTAAQVAAILQTQALLTLTTIGSGAATYSGGTLNIPVGGGGAPTQFTLTNTSTTILTLSCSAYPCNYHVGSVVYTLTGSVTATISGTGTAGTAFLYGSSNQILTLGVPSGSYTFTCSGVLSCVTGITAFPADSTPFWAPTFGATATTWDTIVPNTMDKRSQYGGTVVAPGNGIGSINDPTTGIQTISTDPTQVPRYYYQATAPGTCTAGRDFFTSSSTYALENCGPTNTWNAVGGSSSRTDVQSFPLASAANGSNVALAAASSAGASSLSQTGPGSVGGIYVGALANYTLGNAVMVQKKASHTWNGTTGTIDFALTVVSTGTAGTVTYSGYLGCAAAGTAITYGSVSTQTVAVAATVGYMSTVFFNGVAFSSTSGACAADSMLQFWAVKSTDASSANPYQVSIETVIRGN